jgi:hypothetical protein
VFGVVDVDVVRLIGREWSSGIGSCSVWCSRPIGSMAVDLLLQ